ncbi:MAG: hypothetical protein KAT35_04915 [Candidatus Aenigmarchaeota archaeon]|nr:hypothetical protein [Candidatus Aenigmarchaeota archaeon]
MSDDDPEHIKSELSLVKKGYYKSTLYISDGNFLKPDYIEKLLKSRGAVETYHDGITCCLDLNPIGMKAIAEISDITKPNPKGFSDYLRVSLKGPEDPSKEVKKILVDSKKNPFIESYRGLFPVAYQGQEAPGKGFNYPK